MQLGFNNTHTPYFMDGLQLQTVSEEKDLGVIFSDDLKWEKQCSAAVLKANRILGMLKRNNNGIIQKLSETTLRVLLPDMEPSFLERY